MKKNLKKTLALVMAATLVAASFAACGSKEKEEGGDKPTVSKENTNWEGAEKAAELEGKLTYMHSGDDYEREMYANVFKSYMEYAPNVSGHWMG